MSSTVQCEVRGSFASTASVRNNVMQLEKTRFGATSSRFVDERALQPIPVPHLASHRSGSALARSVCMLLALLRWLIRTLIEEIMVNVSTERSMIELVVHWKGGVHTEISVPKFRTGECGTDTPHEMVDVIRMLALVCSDKTIAAWLSRNQIKAGRGGRWTWKPVAAVRNYRSIPPASKQPGTWLTLQAASALSGINRKMLAEAATRGLVNGLHPLPVGPWVFSRETIEQLDEAQLRKQLGSGTKNRTLDSSLQLNLKISRASDKGAL